MKKVLVLFFLLVFTANVFACAATTKKGTQCTRNPEPGSEYCWQHGGRSGSGRKSGSGGSGQSGSSRSSTSTWLILGVLFGLPASLCAAGWMISKINAYKSARSGEKAVSDKDDVLSRILDSDLSDEEKIKFLKAIKK